MKKKIVVADYVSVVSEIQQFDEEAIPSKDVVCFTHEGKTVYLYIVKTMLTAEQLFCLKNVIAVFEEEDFTLNV